MKPSFSSSTSLIECPPAVKNTDCPLNHGLAVLDQLMAGLEPKTEIQALDLALELRFTLMENASAEAIIGAFCSLKLHIEENHYLACYRLRRWLENQIHAVVKLDRCRPALTLPVRLDQNDPDAIRMACLSLVPSASQTSCATVNFTLTSAT